VHGYAAAKRGPRGLRSLGQEVAIDGGAVAQGEDVVLALDLDEGFPRGAAGSETKRGRPAPVVPETEPPCASGKSSTCSHATPEDPSRTSDKGRGLNLRWGRAEPDRKPGVRSPWLQRTPQMSCSVGSRDSQNTRKHGDMKRTEMAEVSARQRSSKSVASIVRCLHKHGKRCTFSEEGYSTHRS